MEIRQDIRRLGDIVRARDFIECQARSEREKLGLTLENVAAPLGVEPSTVARWETGSQRPRAQHALMYVGLLNRLGRSRRPLDPSMSKEAAHV